MRKTKATAFLLGGALLVTGALGVATSAVAYEVPAAPAIVQNGVGNAVMPGSRLTTSYTAAGLTSLTGAAVLESRGYVPGDYTPPLPGSTQATSFLTNAVNNCPVVGPCDGLGTITVTLSQPVRNPVVSVAGLGAVIGHVMGTKITAQSQLHAVLTVATPGVSLSKLSGGNLAVVNGTTITAVNDSTGYRCDTKQQSDSHPAYPSGATAACGSVRINGLVSSVTFNVSAVRTQSTPGFPPASSDAKSGPNTNADGFALVVTAPEDFGDAPESYDAGYAARAVLSDVVLGTSVSEDNAAVANGAVSPHTSATADADDLDDGVVLPPLTTADGSYSTTVAISGASKAGTVCGWVDFGRDGRFDVGERACAAFAAGATSATLTWAGPLAPVEGETFARFRIGYNQTQVESPVGAADSGEVEDYRLVIGNAVATTPTPPVTPAVPAPISSPQPEADPAPPTTPEVPATNPEHVAADPASSSAATPEGVAEPHSARSLGMLASTGASLLLLPAAVVLSAAGALFLVVSNRCRRASTS